MKAISKHAWRKLPLGDNAQPSALQCSKLLATCEDFSACMSEKLGRGREAPKAFGGMRGIPALSGRDAPPGFASPTLKAPKAFGALQTLAAVRLCFRRLVLPVFAASVLALAAAAQKTNEFSPRDSAKEVSRKEDLRWFSLTNAGFEINGLAWFK